MSMGGVATAQPLDINGANGTPPVYRPLIKNIFSKCRFVLFCTAALLPPCPPPMVRSAVLQRWQGASVMPALAMVWVKGSKAHHRICIWHQRFCVTFPQNNANAINMPQKPAVLVAYSQTTSWCRVGFTYASTNSTNRFLLAWHPHLITPRWSWPNPLSSPSPTLGCQVSDKATALGIGAQLGIYYNSGKGIKLAFIRPHKVWQIWF